MFNLILYFIGDHIKNILFEIHEFFSKTFAGLQHPQHRIMCDNTQSSTLLMYSALQNNATLRMDVQ